MYKQLIIARKDLNMSPGKLAAQVSHGSMAFLTNMIKKNRCCYDDLVYRTDREPLYMYEAHLVFDQKLYEEWINGSFTKIICEAKNKRRLLRAADMARDLGLVEGKDFFLIRDNCLTQLEPEDEDEDEDEDGRTLTCIGFKPMEDEVIEKISKKYQLFR